MYTTPFGNIIRSHNLDFHLYADDTHLYISIKPCDSISRQTAISQVEACIKDIKTWMTNNLLELNDDKTELIIVTTTETTSHQEDIVINICDSPIATSMEPHRNLGVLFDSTCCLNDHGNKICKNINYQLYNIGKILMYLNKPMTEKMINSAVTSWRHLVVAWKVLASVVLRMPPLLSGTRSPSPSSVPSPLTFSRAIGRHICLISQRHNCDVTFHTVCFLPASV